MNAYPWDEKQNRLAEAAIGHVKFVEAERQRYSGELAAITDEFRGLADDAHAQTAEAVEQAFAGEGTDAGGVLVADFGGERCSWPRDPDHFSGSDRGTDSEYLDELLGAARSEDGAVFPVSDPVLDHPEDYRALVDGGVNGAELLHELHTASEQWIDQTTGQRL